MKSPLDISGIRAIICFMVDYQFKKFSGVYPRGDTKIGINKSGLIRLSAGFCRITNIKKFKFTIMYYDGNNNAIALKFTSSREDGRLKVTHDGTGATVSGSSFMKANNLNLKNISGRYGWKKNNQPEIGEVFIIELDKK